MAAAATLFSCWCVCVCGCLFSSKRLSTSLCRDTMLLVAVGHCSLSRGNGGRRGKVHAAKPKAEQVSGQFFFSFSSVAALDDLLRRYSAVQIALSTQGASAFSARGRCLCRYQQGGSTKSYSPARGRAVRPPLIRDSQCLHQYPPLSLPFAAGRRAGWKKKVYRPKNIIYARAHPRRRVQRAR